MRLLVRRHPLAAFLFLAYAGAAIIFAIPLLSTAGIGALDLELPGATPFVLLAAIELAVAAFVTTALADGRDGVRELRGERSASGFIPAGTRSRCCCCRPSPLARRCLSSVSIRSSPSPRIRT